MQAHVGYYTISTDARLEQNQPPTNQGRPRRPHQKMGRTVESYRMALEEEISNWNGFARALRKPEREAFEALMDMCRTHASDGGCATNPIIFEPMIMSIVLEQQLRIRQMENELQAMRTQSANASAALKSGQTEQTAPSALQPTISGGVQPRLN